MLELQVEIACFETQQITKEDPTRKEFGDHQLIELCQADHISVEWFRIGRV